MGDVSNESRRKAWKKGKLIGQKAPFKFQEIWAFRIRLQMQGRLRELALFDLGIDSKLRACDLVKPRFRNVCHGFLFPSRVHGSPHLRTRQYARIVHDWVEEIGLDPTAYGTHSIRRTKPTLGSAHQEPTSGATAHWPQQA